MSEQTAERTELSSLPLQDGQPPATVRLVEPVDTLFADLLGPGHSADQNALVAMAIHYLCGT